VSPDVLSGKAFRYQVIGLSFWFSVPALMIMIVTLMSLLELTSAEWRWFFVTTAIYAVVITPIQAGIQMQFLQPIVAYLDDRARAAASDLQSRLAFARVLDLPRFAAVTGCAGWLVPVILVSLVMELSWSLWSAFQSAVLVMSGVAAGFVAGSFLMFMSKRVAAPVRDALSREIADPNVRAELVRPLAVRTKLWVTVSGVTLVPVVFAALIFEARSERAIEAFAISWQQGQLDALESHLAIGFEVDRALARASVPLPGSEESARVEILDPAEPGAQLALEPEVWAHIRDAMQNGETRGDSLGLPSARYFTWRMLEDGQLLMASVSGAPLRADAAGIWLAIAALFVASFCVAFGLAGLLSADVSDSTERLRREAERLASGDLRPGAACEGEDELGDLSRSFESMTLALRGTVIRVASAADRVEVTAGEMAEAAQTMSSVTTDQVSGIRQTTSSMEAIDQQVQGIARSSQALSVSVEESSSSVLELGASGEELNQTARGLSEQVNEVSSSIEQMVRSVKQVLENTESLAEAAVETSASMGEMATSMRAVDTAAEETARLSQQVVESAETGQAKMVQTIRGMDAIREATETAERVIRGLGTRATEIGAIVDVIDDVADETNLLALNAAIIAAQAGEQGRAFSVVADEIKDLADRVLVSTKEIGAQIRAVQEESANAIGAIERGTESVAGGVDLTAEAGESLEEITRASRESGTRIAGIVSAVREQARAASHVVDLMERVRVGVDEIKAAAQEQDRGNEVVWRGSVAMRDAATQVRSTTEEQARGSGRIGEGVETVREALEQINESLQEQSASCRSAVEFLEAMHGRTRTGEETAQKFGGVAKDLLENAESLREDVARFQI